MNGVKHQWTKASFALHLIIAIAVIFQVSMILLRDSMESLGDTQSAIYGLAITAHKYVGMAGLVVLIVYLIGKLSGKMGNLQYLFPYGKAGRAAIMADVKALVTLRLPVREGGGLAGLVQGLGILLVFGLALTGTVSFILWNYGSDQALASTVFHYHRLLANLIWWYLGGHIGMSIVHWLTPKRFVAYLA